MKTWKDSPIAVIDTETTGLGPDARIIEMSVLVLQNRRFASQLSATFNPGDIDWENPDVVQAMETNKVDRVQLQASKTFDEMWLMFAAHLSCCSMVVGHFLEFDMRMLAQECARFEIVPPVWATEIDTIWLDWGQHPQEKSYRLEEVAKRWKVDITQAHRASSDVDACAKILVAAMDKLPDNFAEFLNDCRVWRQAHRLWREQRVLEREKSKQ